MQDQKSNIENQPRGQQMLPPQGPLMPPLQGWENKLRALRKKKAEKNLFPAWLSRYAMAAYLLALAVVTFLYFSYTLPWYYMVTGVVSILIFFLYGNKASRDTKLTKIKTSKHFEKRIFLIAFVPRVMSLFVLYWIFQANYGDAFGFESADAAYYHDLGSMVAQLFSKGNFHFYDEITNWSGSDDLADMGYGVYVGFLYWLTGNNIIIVRLLKCVWSSLSVVLIYRLAKREFGVSVARTSAIFCALMPNFWYYCGTHLKEVEMVFLTVLFVEQADQMLRSRKFTAWKVAPVVLLAASLFTFRTPLAIVAILALLFTLAMSSTKVIGWGKRIVVGGLVTALVVFALGARIEENARKLMESVDRNPQNNNMEWRATREHGNKYAKYAGAAVFAPMIFTLPFPTMVQAYEGQRMQMLLNGGNYVKNILSFFVIFALVIFLITGQWRDHLLPLSFVVGYLIVLVMSSFPHSERFHQPVLAFEMMFAAYGLSIAVGFKKYKRWFGYWCVLMFVAAIAWNWFKLAGRGMI